jgi:hypothetical protein
MGANTGVATLIDYSQYTDNQAKVKAFKTLLPKVDRNGTVVQMGFFDEMSGAAATQLRVEIDAIAALSAILVGASRDFDGVPIVDFDGIPLVMEAA